MSKDINFVLFENKFVQIVFDFRHIIGWKGVETNVEKGREQSETLACGEIN